MIYEPVSSDSFEGGYSTFNNQASAQKFNSSYLKFNKSFPSEKRYGDTLRRAVSCASCSMCESETPFIDVSDTFPVRKVASCSVCIWDFDERCTPVQDYEELTNSSPSPDYQSNSYRTTSESNVSREKIIVNKRYSFNEEYVYAENKTYFDNIAMSDSDEKECSNTAEESFKATLRRTNSYNSAINLQEIEENVQQKENIKLKKRKSFIEKAFRRVKQRTPPDGGESCELSSNQHSSKESLRSKLSPFKSRKPKTNKNNSMTVEKHCQPTISKNATKELDEIFGKISSSPSASFDDEDDKFNTSFSQDNFATESAQKKILKRLSPRRLVNNKPFPRSRSVEQIYSNTTMSDVVIDRSQSSLEISTMTHYEICGDEEKDSWISYLKMIGGVHVFGGNQSLRYIWQQINSFQQDLCQPFGDFLKSIIEEIQHVYTKSQEMEALVTAKLEQKERERARVYDDVELLIQQERMVYQDKLLEREGKLLSEFENIIEAREAELQTVLRVNNDLTQLCSKYQDENETIKATAILMDEQMNTIMVHEDILKKEKKTLVEEKCVLTERLDEYENNFKELQEHIIKLNKSVDVEREKYKMCYRNYQDVLEEKHFMDVNVGTLSAEVSDLKKHNQQLIVGQTMSPLKHDIDSSMSLIEDISLSEVTVDVKLPEIGTQSTEVLANDVSNKEVIVENANPPAQESVEKRPSISSSGVAEEGISITVKDGNALSIRRYSESSKELNNNAKKIARRKSSLKDPKSPPTPKKSISFNSPLSSPRTQSTDSISPLSPLSSPMTTRALRHFLSADSDCSSYDAGYLSPQRSDEDLFRPVKKGKRTFQTSTPGGINKSQYYCANARTPLRMATGKKNGFKVIFIGDSNVGKTSFIRRLCSGRFRANREMTMERDFSAKNVDYKGNKVRLNLWDSVGQERFNSIPPSYFRNSDVVVLMYDIVEETSFNNVKSWIRSIHDFTNENVFLVLTANKSDLHHKRAVTAERARKLAKDHDAMFVETSAKTGENISTFCDMIVSSLLERDDTVLIRKDFSGSLCSLSYTKRKSISTCCQ